MLPWPVGVGENSRSFPITVDDQIGLTERTRAHDLDRRSSSDAQRRTRKTVWTTRTALRSRWRRFESWRGREIFLPHKSLLQKPPCRDSVKAQVARA
jgi:hypothetical protein